LFFTRFTALGLCLVGAVVTGLYLPAAWAVPLFALCATLSVVGFYDLAQPLHSVRRNYPIIGRLRWFFEEIRPEIRQYLIEGDNDRTPFSRAQRSLVYAAPRMRAATAPSARSSTSIRTAMSSSPIRRAPRRSPIPPLSASPSAGMTAAIPIWRPSSTSPR